MFKSCKLRIWVILKAFLIVALYSFYCNTESGLLQWPELCNMTITCVELYLHKVKVLYKGSVASIYIKKESPLRKKKKILVPRGWEWCKGLITKGQSEGTFEVIELFYIMIVEVVTQLYTSVKICITVYHKELILLYV